MGKPVITRPQYKLRQFVPCDRCGKDANDFLSCVEYEEIDHGTWIERIERMRLCINCLSDTFK